ncbi:Nif3-like dinuclear metal center hexameric protein [Evansella cellulosilytica]|uniref:GTP cyclohydrolase 1 type 2 homolog n=1 Tax=Evansella cellulosilytica (strain ATCC 21833 / DSM 2522 / FERM P-1141 / JCM 9156 / N-4) TaxID=649639 RepID=E6TWD9_EVAC2|nr:Nif3-like dinuclear metal center hexameric protein [Evansella cellulosilytica]ADU31095.1 protein of unknown function DUF34 [Evansella cellulosilytica DSM 2522]
MKTTIQDVIDQLTKPIVKIDNTVDTLKFGCSSQVVTGIVVSFMPTYDAIKKAIELEANLLITHEGIFYSHSDTNTIEKNDVVNKKLELIKQSNITIFRFHDYWHRYEPDGVMKGLVQALQWEQYVTRHDPIATILNVPTRTAEEIAHDVKGKLGISFIRFVGEKEMVCNKIAILVGYRGGGHLSIPLFEKENVDLVIYGEGPEWETPEYVRDALSLGKKKALMIIGHAESEEPGMSYLAELVKEAYPNIRTHFFSTSQLFEIV